MGPLFELDQLEIAIHKKISYKKLQVCKLPARDSDRLQVILYRKNRTLSIYDGTPTADYDGIATQLKGKMWWVG